MNQIYTSEGNIMFVKANGKITNVHPFNVYTHFNKDTVSFVLIALPESSGLSFFTSKADDLEIDGEQYTFDELKEVIPEKFKMSGAQARCEIVEELPTTGQTNTIYLVPIVEGTQVNRYDEYIYIKEQEKWELLGDTSIEMDRYYTKTQVDEKLSAKADTATTYTKSEVDSALASKADTATTYTKTQVDTLLNDKQDTLTAGDGIEINNNVISFDSDKERTIATALSELKNEKLDASVFDAYSAETDTAIANKQDTLVSGTNIKTINNESILGSGNITIEGGGGTVDTEITSASTNPVTSAAIYNQLGGLKLVKLSQSAYDALSTKDSMTLYIIEEAPECNIPSTATWHDVDTSFDRTTQIYGVDFSNGDGGNDGTGRDYSLEVKNANNTIYGITCHLKDRNAEMGDSDSIVISNSDGTTYRQLDYTATINSFCEVFGEPMYISDSATIPSYEQCLYEECTEYDCLQYDEETGECIEQGDCINSECMEYQTTYFITALY